MIDVLISAAVALTPVVAFLAALILLDSFKLVHHRAVLWTIGAGAAVALLCFVLNTRVLALTGIDPVTLTRYVAPAIEEAGKAVFLLYLLRTDKIGFMVDAGIRGFALGTGFAIVENLHYIQARPDAHLFVWIIRGFGTAVMHGGVTAIVGVTTKSLLDKRGRWTILLAVPGLLLAYLLHSAYNHFFVSPLVSTIVILILFPLVVGFVFRLSESSTRDWLGAGFDMDRDVLTMITSGVLEENPIGRYLHSITDRFQPATVADMLCLLRLHSELAIEAKGMLLMREAGFEVPTQGETEHRLAEMRYLRKSIGQTGLLALRPILRAGSREQWQMHLLRRT